MIDIEFNNWKEYIDCFNHGISASHSDCECCGNAPTYELYGELMNIPPYILHSNDHVMQDIIGEGVFDRTNILPGEKMRCKKYMTDTMTYKVDYLEAHKDFYDRFAKTCENIDKYNELMNAIDYITKTNDDTLYLVVCGLVGALDVSCVATLWTTKVTAFVIIKIHDATDKFNIPNNAYTNDDYKINLSEQIIMEMYMNKHFKSPK